MKTKHVRILNIDTEIPPLPVKIPDGKECLIRQIAVDYEEENGSVCGKFLYMISDIEKHLGYGKHGWQQFKDRDYTVEINNKKFSDCETILLGLKGGLVETKRKQRIIPNKSFVDELTHVFEGFLKTRKVFDIISLKETRNALSFIDTPKSVFKKQNVDAIDEVEKGIEDHDFGSRFNSVFKDAKEIAEYGAIAEKEIELTKEICEIRTRIAELQASLKVKEKESKDNRSLLGKYRKSLENNPLLSVNV